MKTFDNELLAMQAYAAGEDEIRCVKQVTKCRGKIVEDKVLVCHTLPQIKNFFQKRAGRPSGKMMLKGDRRRHFKRGPGAVKNAH